MCVWGGVGWGGEGGGGGGARARECMGSREGRLGSGCGQESGGGRARTCVMTPAAAPRPATVAASMPPGSRPICATTLVPKKATPETSMMAGVAAAATPQPRYWNTKRLVSMRAMVVMPVYVATSARTVW